MKKIAQAATASRFSPCATLAVIGWKLRQLDLLQPIKETLAIGQKTVHHSPFDKLLDALITILAGAGVIGDNYPSWLTTIKTPVL